MVSSKRLFYICERVNAEISGEYDSPFIERASDLNEEENEKYVNIMREMMEENERFKKMCEESGRPYRPILIPPVELDWGE